MSESILEGLPRGVEGEIWLHNSNSVSVGIDGSLIQDIKSKQACNTTLRVISKGKLGVASSQKRNGGQTLLRNALDLAAYGRPVNYNFPGQAYYREPFLWDRNIVKMDTGDMVEIVKDLAAALQNFDNRIQVEAHVSREWEQTSLANTAGFFGKYKKSLWTYSLGGQLTQGNDMLWFGDWRSTCGLRQDYTMLKTTVIERFRQARRLAPLTGGRYPVVFAPAQVAYLLEPLLASLNGKALVQGVSPWKNKKGKQLLDKRINLIDDGVLPFTVSSQYFDREGVPCGRHTLIQEGIIQKAILDLTSAQTLGLRSSGNGTLEGPEPHHILLLPGENELPQMLKEINQGLLVYDTVGAWANNPYSGNISGAISLGFLVEKGEVVGRVKDCLFSLNAFEFFRKHLIAVSSETKDEGDGTYPYIALDNVLITAG